MHKHASTNRFYRLVWSHVHACWVAVAEGARGRGKGTARARAGRKLAAVLIGGALGGGGALAAELPLNALPGGAQLVAGQASIASSGNKMTITQGSAQAILNWQSFDIGANAAVRFDQPSASAVALNRVLGTDPSRIYGKLSSNGSVFLINPQGFLFGAGAQVNVGGLVASSLALSDQDFLRGKLDFNGNSASGAIRNDGSIHAAAGGFVALLAPSISNHGSIVAPQGSIALAAAEQVGVDLRGDGLITLRTERGALKALADNQGLLQADGGQVLLTAKAADALTRSTVNNEGLVQARGLVADGGSIRLVGDGDVRAGQLDASSAAGAGGKVAVSGSFVALDAGIDASGISGGSIAVDAATTLSTAAASNARGTLGKGGAISYRAGAALVESGSASANASGATDGGAIAVHAGGSLISSGQYAARGEAGVGGRIDLSGADVRLLSAQLDASGNTQGGLARVGGAFQGGAQRDNAPDLARFVTRWGQTAPIASAAKTFINDSSAIDVAARGAAGQGGTAVVWSQDQSTMLGSVKATGAAAGGTVEISSKNDLRYVGLDKLDIGAGGQLLLDPKNIIIGNYPVAWTYEAILGQGYTGGNNVNVPLAAGDGFGFGVALSANGDRLAVGAPFDAGFAGTGSSRGAVRLYSFTNADFAGAKLEATIGSGYTGGKNLNVALADGDQFGASVALNGAGSRLAVGAVGDNAGYGAVRLIDFTDTAFSGAQVYQTLGFGHATPNLSNTSLFGVSVALNAVGDKLAVGSLLDNGASGTCYSCGAVYLYSSATTNAITFSKAIGAGYGFNFNPGADAQFGTSVAFNGAGDRLAVGAIGADDSKGAVYLFNNPYGANTAPIALGSGLVTLNSSEAFGASVSFNTAGTRLAVGASGNGGFGAIGTGPGNVRIIDFDDGNFTNPKVSATLGRDYTVSANADLTLGDSDSFGFAVALNGSGDRLVVGAPYANSSDDLTASTGSVHAFALLPVAATTSVPFSSVKPKPGLDVTVDAAKLTAALDAGVSITLQANNDITLEAGNAISVGAGINGALTLQAGRSIFLKSNITTGNANLTLMANESVTNGVVNAYRDVGLAGITMDAGTAINAGTGTVSMTIGNGGTGKTNIDSGVLAINGSLTANSVVLKNFGLTAGSNIVLGASSSITGNGLGTAIEIAAAGNGTFQNFRGTAGLNVPLGRYLVYSNSPASTIEGVTVSNKHYNQAYTGSTPGYAASGNWFLYSIAPTLTVGATAGSTLVYDGGTANTPTFGYSKSGFIDGDTASIFTGALAAIGLTKNVGAYSIGIGSLANSLGYAISYTGSTYNITARPLTVTGTAAGKIYDGLTTAAVSYTDNRIGGDVLTVSNTAANFNNKNVGTGKTVAVTGIALSGTDAANYSLAGTTATLSADITARLLTATASAAGKIYDGNTSASATLGDNRVLNDVLTLSNTGAVFSDKNAAAGKTVTVSGISASGTDAGNYVLASTSATTTAGIVAKTLTASATGVNKVYDGGTGATVTFGDNRITNDDLTIASTGAAYADKNVAAGKAVSVSGMTISGADAGNYVLASTVAATTAAITKKTLTATASGVNKTYDGSTAAGATLADDRVAGDLLTVSNSAATFNDKNVGSGKAVSVTGIALAGTDAGNYMLASTSASTSANVTARSLVASATGSNKVYDGSTGASVVLGDDRVAGDVLTLASTSAAFASKDAGLAKPISVGGITVSGTDAANYTLASSSATASANITARTLTATAAGVNRTYDGSLGASVSFTDDRVAGDVLAYSDSASFGNKNAGSGKTVSVSGITLAGADAANYVLASTTATTTADISTRSLTASATGIDKVYDGNTAGTVSFGDNRVAGDVLTLANSGAAFADKNAGTGKQVTVTGISMTGTDAANYTLSSTSANTSANITARTLTATAAGVNRVYDGSTTASATLSDDRVALDVLNVTSTGASFADKNAATGKTVSVSGISISGADAANYVLASTTASTSAAITARTLTATATGVNRVYDGSTAASATFADNRINGDVLTVSNSAASFADKNVGTGKAVSVTGIALAGTDAGNYMLASTSASTSANVTARSLVASATGSNKVYDGSTGASVVLGDDRVAGDILTLASTSAAFASKDAGLAKPISVGGISVSGTDAANYTLASSSTTASANITARTLTATAAGVNRTYDGSLGATVSFTDDRVAGDVLAYSDNASFGNKNAGIGKTVSVSGITLAGADAANYVLASTTATTTADIGARSLTVSATGIGKVYDGNTAGAVSLGDNRVAGDVLTLANSGAAFADKNAGTGKTVTVSGISISGADAGNYSVASATATTSADVTQRSLAVNATGINKTYDGNTGAGVTLGDNRVAGDVLTLANSAAAFIDKNVGTGKLVNVSGISMSGADAANYTLASTGASATANVSARTLHASASGVSKVYDGSTVASATFADDRVAGDTLVVSNAAASFADKNAGAGKAVAVTGISLSGVDAGNYVLASTTGATTASITQRSLLASATGNVKVYDGGTLATVVLGDNRVAGDALSLTAAGAAFADKNVGTGKAIAVSGIALAGADAANYTLASTSAATSAAITKRTLNPDAIVVDKVYDGNTVATVTFADNRVAGDVLAVASGGASFGDKNVGLGKQVGVTGITISGTDAGNYQLASVTATKTANITPRVLTATANGIDKVYDGALAATVSLGDDRIAGDVLALTSGAAAFADKNAGAGKAVSVTGIASSGLDAGNYTLASTSAAATAAITARSLIAGAVGIDKVYDGITAAGATFTDNRLAGDVLTVAAGSTSFADKNAGVGKAVTASGLTLAGADAGNYTLASTVAGTTASITPRAITASVSSGGKVYDGNTVASVVLGDDRIALDQLTLSSSAASYADKNVGSKSIVVSGIALAGIDAGNYTLTSTGASGSGVITARTLSASASGVGKVYDATTGASVTLGDDRVAGDVLALTASAAFTDKNAGAAKAIVVSGLALSGADAGNYVLGSTTLAASAEIAKRSLVVSATAADKTYDGSNSALVSITDTRIGGDVLNFANTGATFADKNAGKAKAVTLSGLAISGADAGNYALASNTATTTASIAAKALSATLAGTTSKIYDGGNAVMVDAGKVVFTGFTAGEGASAGRTAGTFNSANVVGASSVTSTFGSADITAANGTLLSNYILPATASGAGAITPKAVSVAGIVAAPKVFDGSSAASLSNSGSVAGLVAGESLQLNGPSSVSFDNRSAGTGKLVTATGFSLANDAGGLASNYVLANNTASTSAGIISQATLTVKANDAERTLGASNPAFSYTIAGLVGGDSNAIVPALATGTTATLQSPVGSYPIQVGGATLNDYKIVFVDGALSVTGTSPQVTSIIDTIAGTVSPPLTHAPAAGLDGMLTNPLARAPAGGFDLPVSAPIVRAADSVDANPSSATAAAPASIDLATRENAGTGAPAVTAPDRASGNSGTGRAPAVSASSSTITLSGGTQIIARNGGLRTDEGQR